MRKLQKEHCDVIQIIMYNINAIISQSMLGINDKLYHMDIKLTFVKRFNNIYHPFLDKQ